MHASELAGNYHELIFELNKVNSGQLLLGVLANLERELLVEDTGQRALAVQLLARMFAAKGSALAHSYRPLFATFLARFRDVDETVRLIMCECARHLIADHEEVAAAVWRELLQRLRDQAERVRQGEPTNKRQACVLIFRS